MWKKMLCCFQANQADALFQMPGRAALPIKTLLFNVFFSPISSKQVNLQRPLSRLHDAISIPYNVTKSEVASTIRMSVPIGHLLIS